MDALAKFLANRSFVFNDITIAKRIDINRIGTKWVEADCEQPADLLDWDTIVPKMDIWLDVAPNEMHYVASIIPTLKWRGGKLGVRLALLPKDVSNLFNEYREAYSSARTTEHARVEKSSFNLFPKDLCEFLDRKLTTYFSIKAFILDPSHFEDAPVQPTSFEAECLTDNPLKDIVRVDMIDAQRGFADPDSSEGTEKVRKQLSAQMRNYYEKHLDPEKAPSPEDLDILEATEGARQVFDKTLALKFAPAIKELEGLGYPGISDPKLTITTKVMTSETLKHDSAVQYALSKTDNTLKLPEKYNGLGYQNLISMVFDLMGFRDDWMREGKAKDTNTVIEPMHLVLVEEPEAHLHIQVQQVFIRQAYKVLTKVQTLPKWHICPNLGRICRCNGVFQCFQFIHALTFGLGQHIFRLGKAVLSQLGGAFAVFWLSSHGFNSSSKIFLRNSSTISAARFCISVVVWVGVLGERRPGMSQDSRQSLYIYTRCQRMGGKSVVQTMKPDIRQLRPF